jgi:membrane protein YqaA with SNARE-associated domain
MEMSLALIAETWLILRKWGALGLVAVALIDSSVIPLPGSLDVFTILLAIRHRELWLYYALVATAGSVMGGYLTYRLGKKGGEVSLERRLARKQKRTQALFEKWGSAAVFVPAVLPPPVPMVPFILVAGAMDYPAKKFLGALAAGRAVRFIGLAYLASAFGGTVLRALMSHYAAALWLLLAAGLFAASILILLHFYRKYYRKRAAPSA